LVPPTFPSGSSPFRKLHSITLRMLVSQPPPYEPRMSAVRRFLNWIAPPLVFPVEQLRPDTEYVERMVSATRDIRLCEDLFNEWSTHLIKITSEKPDEREREVRHHLACLKESASWCSEATSQILRCHVHFAHMMARRIDGASKSWFKGLDCDTDTTKLATDIAKASRSLSQNVVRLQSDLALFVSDLEKMDVKKRQSIVRRILGWLKHLFNALAGVFALGSFIAPFLHSVAPGVGLVLPAASVLSMAAAKFSGMAAEKYDAKEPEDIESALLFLKETVPREALDAQYALARFDEALLIMGLEEHMINTGRRVALRGPDPAAIADEWIKVARQYQSMLPVDESPVG